MMTTPTFRRTTCRLCDSPDVTVAVPMRASPIADAYVQTTAPQASYAMDLYLCRACGHVQLLDVVDPSLLFGEYLYTTSTSLGLVEHFRNYATSVTNRFAFPPGALAVDIGSNDGTLLRFFRDSGLRVLGVDPAREIASKATEAGVQTIPEFFTSSVAQRLATEHGPAALITANNVFAHSDALPDMADGIRAWLAKDGIFVFEVSYLLDIVEKMLFDTVFHEHLCFHSIRPLKLFFARHDLELFAVERLPTKGGSIRGFVQRAGGGRAVDASVGALLELEERTGLAEPAVFSEYARRIDDLRTELCTLLDRLTREGKSIAGYGASATVTTLIHQLDLGRYLRFLADDNPQRHGLFSPGLHLPVVSSEELYTRKPDYVVVLAWMYAGPILAKNTRFTDQGGHFILPLPRVQIV